MSGMLSPQREAVVVPNSVLLMQEGILPRSQGGLRQGETVEKSGLRWLR